MRNARSQYGRFPCGWSVGNVAKLQLEVDKAKPVEMTANAGQSVAEAQEGSLTGIVPATPDSPKGEVRLGEKAGRQGSCPRCFDL